jgi:hypothetical protein
MLCCLLLLSVEPAAVAARLCWLLLLCWPVLQLLCWSVLQLLCWSVLQLLLVSAACRCCWMLMLSWQQLLCVEPAAARRARRRFTYMSLFSSRRLLVYAADVRWRMLTFAGVC